LFYFFFILAYISFLLTLNLIIICAEILNQEFSSKKPNRSLSTNANQDNDTNQTNLNQSIDVSDILAPSELEDLDLLKNEDFNFDLASKSLLFNTVNKNNNKNGNNLLSTSMTSSSSSTPKKFSSQNKYAHITGKFFKNYSRLICTVSLFVCFSLLLFSLSCFVIFLSYCLFLSYLFSNF